MKVVRLNTNVCKLSVDAVFSRAAEKHSGKIISHFTSSDKFASDESSITLINSNF